MHSADLIDLLAATTPAAPAPVPPVVTPLLATAPATGAPNFTLQEDASAEWAAVVYANAQADATLAYALDFEHPEQQRIKAVAGDRLLAVRIGTPGEEVIRLLLEHLQRLHACSLNVTGSDLYALGMHFAVPGKGSRQERAQSIPALQARVDGYMQKVLAAVHAQYPLTQLRAGGQPGVEEAGIRAGIALGVPTLAYMPKGFRFRNAIGDMRVLSPDAAYRRFLPPAASNDPF